jgi:probable phosphoglycerate mutase
MKRLYFVRHGLTHANVDNLFSGLLETELTDEGKAQAARAGEELLKEDVDIDLIIASPLIRTQETARIIAERIGYPVQQILNESLIVERAFGHLEGTKVDEFFSTNEYEDLDKIDGVESVEMMHERALKALEALKRLPEDNVLIVSHGSFGRAIRRAANDEPHTAEYIKDFRKHKIANAEIIRLI